ncbi:hypothetical protein [Enterobacter quasiroggenkampii]|uniref:hypothetical protein n=1 Tax=Enterobacter quasiroggenkampii TaxID=2497436 RepID=UPI003B97F5C2
MDATGYYRNWLVYGRNIRLSPADPGQRLQQEGIDIALERRSLVQDAITRGELVQLTSVTAPYPWPYWLVTAQLTEAKPEVAPFKAWLEEDVVAWRQLTGS